MSKEERHLQTKIRMNKESKSSRQHPNGIDKDESKIAKIILQENGVLTRALSFLCVSFCH